MIRLPSLLFWTVMAIGASLALYHTSYRVHDLSQQLHTLNASIEAEQRNIHVLKAEWVYLTNPAKIEQAARKYLPLQPTAIQQIARLDMLPDLVPTRAEAMADMTVTHTPMATLRGATPASTNLRAAPARGRATDDDRAHLNTRMIMQPSGPTASAEPKLDQGSFVLANIGSRP